MKLHAHLVHVVLVALATACAASPPPSPVAPGTPVAEAGRPHDAARGARIDDVLARAVADKRVVGAVVIVREDGRVVHRRAVGQADREANRPLTVETPFRLASMTKPIVTVTALALVEKGTLKLEDPVTKWIPDFRPRTANGDTPVITVEQLITHTSGLGYGFLEKPDGPYHRAHVSDGLDQPGLSIEENLKRLGSVPLLAAPGSAFHYSLSIDVLGEVIARAAGMPLPRAVETFVTRPLGLEETTFHTKDAARLATPYADGKPEPKRMGDPEPVPLFGLDLVFSPGRTLDARSYPSGGAGMNGTADEYVVFLEALRTRDARLLRAATASAMFENHIGDRTAPELGGPGWAFGYGGAVLVDPVAAKSPLGKGTLHWGGAWGHSWWVDPEAKLTIVLLTNTAFEGMVGKLPDELIHAVYGR